MSWPASRWTLLAACVALVLILSSSHVDARPNRLVLTTAVEDLLDVEPQPDPCDAVWRFLDQEAARLHYPDATVSIRHAYAVSGLSLLTSVWPDDAGRFALVAPLMRDGTNALGRVDVRFSRVAAGVAADDYRYAVHVRTCGANGCEDSTTERATPRECSAERDVATLVVQGKSARDEVHIRFRR